MDAIARVADDPQTRLDWKPGFNVTSKGIFVGTHTLKVGRGAAGRFNVFAAPQDFNIYASSEQRIPSTFNKTAAELVKRGIWFGHECNKFDAAHYHEQLSAGLKDGSAVGKWFIPTCEILCGRDANDRKVQPRNLNLCDLRQTGDLRNTFYTGDYREQPYYLSSTELRDDSDYVWVVNLYRRHPSLATKSAHMSCRPVRVELAL